MLAKQKHIAIITLSLVLAVSTMFGQSRLDVGKVPVKSNFNSGPISSLFLNKNLNSDFKLSNTYVVNGFYRNALLNSTPNEKIKLVEKEAEVNLETGDSIGNIYPNPANEVAYLNYSLKSKSKNAKVSIYNILGQKVSDLPLNESEGKLTIITRNWNNGMYLYQLIVDNKKLATKKLLVRHN